MSRIGMNAPGGGGGGGGQHCQWYSLVHNRIQSSTFCYFSFTKNKVRWSSNDLFIIYSLSLITVCFECPKLNSNNRNSKRAVVLVILLTVQLLCV